MDKCNSTMNKEKSKSESIKESELESELETTEFAVLDLETTGLNVKTNEILSIAIIPMTGLRIHVGRCFYTLIKSDKFDERSIKLHGICPGDLEKATIFEDVYSKIYAMLNERIIVGFNVRFDIAFLKEKSRKLKNAEKNLDLKYIDIRNVESWILQRTGKPVPVSLDLSDLLNKYGIEKVSRHNALGDAYLTARVFQNQMIVLLKYKLTIKNLIQISRNLTIF